MLCQASQEQRRLYNFCTQKPLILRVPNAFICVWVYFVIEDPLRASRSPVAPHVLDPRGSCLPPPSGSHTFQTLSTCSGWLLHSKCVAYFNWFQFCPSFKAYLKTPLLLDHLLIFLIKCELFYFDVPKYLFSGSCLAHVIFFCLEISIGFGIRQSYL